MGDQIEIRDLFQGIAGATFPELFVFASPTIEAPSMDAGIVMFGSVIGLSLLVVIGLFNTDTFGTAIKHLFMGIISSYIIAITFGYIWLEIPLNVLFSIGFVETTAFIAFCVGLFPAALINSSRD